GALHQRQRTGKGARVEVNMLETAVAFSPEGFAQYTRNGTVPGPLSRVAVSQSYAFRCADERLLVVHLSSVEKFWQGFLAAIERPDLAQDERFRTPQDRTRHYTELADVLGPIMTTRPRDE